MKTPLIAMACVIALALTAWCVKHSTDTRAVEAAVAPQIAEPASGAVAQEAAPTENLLPSRNTPAQKAASAAVPSPAPVHYGMTQETLPASQSTLSSTPRNPTRAYESHRSSPPVASRSPERPATPASTGMIPQTAVSSNGNFAASEPGAIELDPGVPAPVALMPSQENQSPIAAAAQQQLADSFVQEVNAALSQPGTTEAAASDSYFNALEKSNEQFRALYGNEAYNSVGMQAALEAQTGK